MSWAQLEERTNRAALRVFGSTQDAPAKLGARVVAGDLVEAGDQVFLDGVSAVANQTMFCLATPDEPQGVVGMQLHVGARSWNVVDSRPDGRGITCLYLEVAR